MAVDLFRMLVLRPLSRRLASDGWGWGLVAMRSFRLYQFGLALLALLAAPFDALSQPATDKPAAAAQQAAPPPPDAPNIFIIRIYAEPKMMAVTIKIDDRKVVSLGQHTYTSLYVPPGHHDFGVRWSIFSGQISPHFDVNIEPGRTYYFSIVGTRRAAGYGTVKMVSGFSQLNATIGAATVAECCAYTPPIR